jgi:hypothetical protein
VLVLAQGLNVEGLDQALVEHPGSLAWRLGGYAQIGVWTSA